MLSFAYRNNVQSQGPSHEDKTDTPIFPWGRAGFITTHYYTFRISWFTCLALSPPPFSLESNFKCLSEISSLHVQVFPSQLWHQPWCKSWDYVCGSHIDLSSGLFTEQKTVFRHLSVLSFLWLAVSSHKESKGIPEKLLFHWLFLSLWLRGS